MRCQGAGLAQPFDHTTTAIPSPTHPSHPIPTTAHTHPQPRPTPRSQETPETSAQDRTRSRTGQQTCPKPKPKTMPKRRRLTELTERNARTNALRQERALLSSRLPSPLLFLPLVPAHCLLLLPNITVLCIGRHSPTDHQSPSTGPATCLFSRQPPCQPASQLAS